MSFHWNDDNAALARRLYIDEGRSASAVAREIGASSRNAVIGKAHRSGWGSPSKATTQLNIARASRAGAAATKARTAGHRPPPRPAAPRPASHPPIAAAAIDVSNARPWLQRGLDECAYPVAGDGADTLSCCAPTPEGRSYYPGHSALMHVPLTERQRSNDRKAARAFR